MQWIVQVPADNERGPAFMESVLRLLHKAFAGREAITLDLQTRRGELMLAIGCSDEMRAIVQSALLDAYPGMILIPAATQLTQDHPVVWWRAIRLSLDVLRFRTFPEFPSTTGHGQVDPMAVILSAIRLGRSGRIECRLRITVRPATHKRQHVAERIVRIAEHRIRGQRWRHRYLLLASNPSRCLRLAGKCFALAIVHRGHNGDVAPTAKVRDPLWDTTIAAAFFGPEDAVSIAERKLREICGAFAQFRTGETQFVSGKTFTRSKPIRRGSLLNSTELATLWHPLTTSSVGVSRIIPPRFREIEPPLNLPSKEREHGVLTLGRVRYRNSRDQFGIRLDDLRRHLFVVGKTGCGKSTFLAGIVQQAIDLNLGCVLIDPHGELASDILGMIPRRRTNDVIVFDASDREYVVGFNPLIGPQGSDPTLVADGVLTSFQHVFGFDETSAPRLLHIFRNSLLSMIGRPDATLHAVQRLLVDATYRKSIVAEVRNVVVREFWHSEFNRWNDRDRTQYVASLQNKLGAFTSNERLQSILGITHKGMNLRTVLDSSQILICNLSKGTLGHEASTLLGSLLISSLQLAAMSRADVPEMNRPDSVIVVDEVHSYLSERNPTFASALAESRKYRASYVLSTQLLDQLDEATLASILGNCGSTMAMTVGPRDAILLSELLHNDVRQEELTRTPKYHAYLKLLVDGKSHTLSMSTVDNRKISGRGASMIRKVSRLRHGRKLPS